MICMYNGGSFMHLIEGSHESKLRKGNSPNRKHNDTCQNYSLTPQYLTGLKVSAKTIFNYRTTGA